MGAILYYLLLPVLYFVSVLPFRLLYVLSDVFYFFIYSLIGYRKKVVLQNLHNSFPGKTEAEIQKICTDFYHFFCDLVLESFKTLTISPRSLRRHFLFPDPSVLKHYYDLKQNVILVLGHLGNWELGGARLALEPYHQVYIIYHPLSNKYFEGMVRHMRTRLGSRLYAMKDVLRGMIRDRNVLSATAFVSDQSPTSEGVLWMNFLNQDTAVFTGAEKIAKKFGYPVLYLSIMRPRRGQYKMDVELLTEHPENTAEDEITCMHTKRLEQDILENPHTWLWTHRRWKRKRG